MIIKNKNTIFIASITLLSLMIGGFAYAAAPSGADWFQILASPFTGSDNTGDGGTGSASDLNYYYVGQSFTGTMQINSGGADAANIWVDYDTSKVSASSLNTGSFFNQWISQSISGGRIKSTGYSTSGTPSGQGTFGTVTFTMLEPTASSYGTGAPTTLDINIGSIGATTESNITLSGSDILDSAEDFQMHIWADTVKPYLLDASPAHAATNVAVNANYTFTLCDSKSGEAGDSGTCLSSGVGTGVNTATPPGVITVNDGSGAVDYTAYDSYSCSGAWGTNDCDVTLNPPSPDSISGDSRNWKYATTYTVNINSFRDLASSSQNQLGDSNGPNTMDSEVLTFTTEGDNVAPQVVSETPSRGSSGQSVSTNITVNVEDRKTYPGGPSGEGIDASTCSINVSSPSFTLTTYQQGSSGVTVNSTDFGYQFVINPATDFSQNETISVSVYGCTDTSVLSNQMTTDNYTFSTSDSDAPFVDQLSPLNDGLIALDGVIKFHLQDSGVGVDLANTVFIVNGTYYTNGGGAGSIAVDGKTISFASSLNFNGGNYTGDTTGKSGTSSDYTFTIDPENNFTEGENVPVIVYSRDTAGNIMDQVIFGVVAGSASCNGQSFCGSNTSWNGAQCIGSGSGSVNVSPTTTGSTALSIDENSIIASPIDESSILVNFYSNKIASAWLVYGTSSPGGFGESPLYGYTNRTAAQNDNSIFHSIKLDGLQSGIVYYIRPVVRTDDGEELRGPEVRIAPKQAVRTITVEKETTLQCQPEVIIREVPVVVQPDGSTTPAPVDTVTPVDTTVPLTPVIDEVTQRRIIYVDTYVTKINNQTLQTDEKVSVVNIDEGQQSLLFNGLSRPNSNLRVTIY